MMAHFSSILTYTQLIGYGNEIGTYTIIVWIEWNMIWHKSCLLLFIGKVYGREIMIVRKNWYRYTTGVGWWGNLK